MYWKPIYNSTSVSVTLLFITFTIFSQPTYKSTDIYSTISIEQQFIKQKNDNILKTTPHSEALRIYSSLPAVKIANKKIFTAIEVDLLNKDLFLYEKKLNEGFFQRYGLFIGTGLIKNEKQKSAIYLGGGIASDFPALEKDCGYFHLIYDHGWLISDKLKLGIGLLLSYNIGSWKDPQLVNLLPTLQWSPSDKLNINIAWDSFKIRRFITTEITAVLEARYDLSFFKLTKDYSAYFETVGVAGGFDVNLFKSYYLQLRYKEVLYNNNYIKHNSKNSTHSLNNSEERTISISIVYAK